MSTSSTHGVIPEWTLADRLRKAREVTGLEQTEFADELGLSRSTVSNYERGATKPRKIALNAWALRTGVPLEWILQGESSGPRSSGEGGAQWSPRPDSNRQPTDYQAEAAA